MSLEYWTQVNIVVHDSPDEVLLCDYVYPLIKKTFADQVSCWFYFWEPDLLVRFRWLDEGAKSSAKQALFSTLEDWKARGLIKDWCEGNHFQKGDFYKGEAHIYGEDMWPACQKDWMNGSEFAVRLIQLERAGKLSKNRDYHWCRHVHLFSNQLVHNWDQEIRLSINQALGYLKLLKRGLPEGHNAVNEMIAQVKLVLDCAGQIKLFQDEMMERWNAAGRPDWSDFLRLEGDEHKI